MIPNVRLMIVALFASIVAISCGLGLFAAFRVNNEQFARAPNGSPLLQLAFVAPASITDATAASTIAVHLRMNTPAASTASTDLAAIKRDDAAAEPAKSIAVEPAPATAPSFSDNAPTVTSSPAAAGSDTGQETSQATGKDEIGDVAVASPADQSPPADPAVQKATAAPHAPSAEAAPAAKAVKKMTRRRVVRLRRLVQPQAAIAAQPADQVGAFPQPAFQPAAQAIAPQTVRRRIVVKRRRSANTTAATTTVPRRTVVGTTPASTAIR
jgi:hypothetical protein